MNNFKKSLLGTFCLFALVGSFTFFNLEAGPINGELLNGDEIKKDDPNGSGCPFDGNNCLVKRP